MEGLHSKKSFLNLKRIGNLWKQPGDFAFVSGRYVSRGLKTKAFCVTHFFSTCILKNAGGTKYNEELAKLHAYEQRPGSFSAEQGAVVTPPQFWFFFSFIL